MAQLLIADTEPTRNTQLKTAVGQLGHHAIAIGSAQEILEYLLWKKEPFPDLVLLDISLPDMDIPSLLHTLRTSHPHLPTLVLCMQHEEPLALQACRAGALDFLTRPISPEKLEVAITNALGMRELRHRIKRWTPHSNSSLLAEDYRGFSDLFMHTLAQGRHAAHHDTTLIIEGEPGVGKETLARAIHQHSRHADRPFSVINTEQSIESLHHSLAQVQGGTLMVRHHDAASSDFIRCLEQLYRTMTDQDTRLIFCHETTPAILAQELVERYITKTHRPETITIPPLRARRRDIPLLAERFIRPLHALFTREGFRLSDRAMEHLTARDWPANLRELNETLFLAAGRCRGNVIEPRHFAPRIPHIAVFNERGALRSLEEIEHEIINFALDHCQTSRSDIARMLGIGRTTLYRKVRCQIES